MKITTERGSEYRVKDGYFSRNGGISWRIQEMFFFDRKGKIKISSFDDFYGLLDVDAIWKMDKPAVGLSMYVSSSDGWYMSTEIIFIDEENDND
jgi:hypothetical protein